MVSLNSIEADFYKLRSEIIKRKYLLEAFSLLLILGLVTIETKIIYQSNWINYLLYDGDSLTLALLVKSIFIKHEAFKYIGSAQLNLFPEGIIYLSCYFLTKSFKASLLLNSYVNILLLYLCIRLIVSQLKFLKYISKISLSLFMIIIFMIIIFSEKQMNPTSGIATTFLLNTYYSGCIFAGLLDIYIILKILSRPILFKMSEAIFITLFLSAVTISNPLFIVQFTIPIILILSLMVFTKKIVLRKYLLISFINYLALSIYFITSKFLKNLYGVSPGRHINLNLLRHPTAFSPFNFFSDYIEMFGAGYKPSFNSEIHAFIPVILYFAIIIFLLLNKGRKSKNVIYIFLKVFVISYPMILYLTLFLVKDAAIRYFEPLYIVTIIGTIIMTENRKVIKTINYITIFSVPIIILFSIYALKYPQKIITTETPSLNCFAENTKPNSDRALSPYGLRYLELYGDSTVNQSAYNYKEYPWLINMANYDNHKYNLLLKIKSFSEFNNFNTTLGPNETIFGKPITVKECGLFYIYRYQRPILIFEEAKPQD